MKKSLIAFALSVLILFGAISVYAQGGGPGLITQPYYGYATLCNDSDGGINYAVKGTCYDEVFPQGLTDSCNGPEGIVEYSCEPTTSSLYRSGVGCFANITKGLNACPNGCAYGVCLTSTSSTNCTIEGEGIPVTPRGYNQSCCPGLVLCPPSAQVARVVVGIRGTCQKSCNVTTNVTGCTANTDCYPQGFIPGKCGPDYICSIGRCYELIRECPFANETTISVCQGCELDSNCYPFGYRKGSDYCSENKTFDAQKGEKSVCDNNFECSSNVCVSGQCVSQNLIQMILEWFRKLFGSA